MLYAGSSSTTIGNPIGDVTTALAVSFVGGGTHAVTCPSGGGGGGGRGGPRSDSIQRATAAKERHAGRLMADPAIQGVGVGAADDNPEQAVVVLYVETGRAHGPLPTELDGVPVKVIQTDRFVAYGWNEPETPQVCTSR